MIKKAATKFGIFLLNALSLFPLPVLYLLADLVYYILYYMVGYRRKVVEENLRNAFPEKSDRERTAISKKYYRHLTSLMVEILKMATISKAELQRRFRFKNLHLITDYLKSGKGVFACSAHYGNWEWGTLVIGLQVPAEVYPIYKPVSNEAFGQWFSKIRSRFGNHLIPMRQTLRALTDSKDRPTLFLFGNDQTPTKSESTFWIDFLNQPTAILPGLEKLALRTNRPVFYLKSTVLKRGYYEVDCVPICLEPALTAPNDITIAHVRMLEGIIKEEPAYWLWSHRRWKHKPDVKLI
jgi:KDO2-lipid IV(A) lauroyltransferase